MWQRDTNASKRVVLDSSIGMDRRRRPATFQRPETSFNNRNSIAATSAVSLL